MNRMIKKLADERGQRLALFLNATDGIPKQRYVLRVIDICHRLLAVMWRSQPNVEEPDVMKVEIRRGILEGELNDALRQYRFRPSVSAFYQFSVHWLPDVRPTMTKLEIERWKTAGQLPIGEVGAIQIVLDLASLGLLDRIRRCEVPYSKGPELCGNWFMAINNKKRVCGDNCRVRKGQYGDGFKQKRRSYMRKYNFSNKPDRRK
ncbi:MAG: hypothetical protein WA655_24230 [Candidatus Korobacteraceae bacterium]